MYWDIFFSLSKSPAEKPMLIAVSILSPVRTHTLIPTFFMNWILSATWSWSLSSMAVDPMSSKSCSISSSTLATSSSLFLRASLAYSFLLCHARYSCSSIYLSATNSVLRPSSANPLQNYWVLPKTYLLFSLFASLSSITESAPLQKRR